jgi:hypothetical protein
MSDQQQLTIGNSVPLERMMGRATETKRLRTLRMLLAGELDNVFASHRTDMTRET